MQRHTRLKEQISYTMYTNAMPQSEKLFIRVSNMFISKFQNFKDVEIAKSVFILNTMQTKERDLKLDARIL